MNKFNNNNTPMRGLLGPWFDIAINAGTWLGEKLDKWIDEAIPRNE